MAKFLIADDHPLFREALSGALTLHFDNPEIVQSESLDTTLDVLQNNKDIDIVLLDLNMPGCENFYGLFRVNEDFPAIPVAVVSASDSVKVISQAMNFGAKGFIPKTTHSDQIAQAIREIMAGNQWLPEGIQEQLDDVSSEQMSVAQKVSELTPKQFQVLKYLQQGKLNKQIAYDMHVTEATVKAHISAILRKFDVNTRTQAVLLIEQLQSDL